MIDFRTMPSAILSCVVLMMLFIACSVKENRDECPCLLMLDFSGLDSAQVKSVNVLAVSADGVVFKECVRCEDFAEIYVREVPHGFIKVNVWSGSTRESDSEHLVHIPYGMECPPVHIHSFVADTRGESCRAQVSLNKNYCSLTVMMPDGTKVPYSMTFKGNVDGFDVNGKPSSGAFACVAYPSDSGDSQALLPRQVDTSLLLEVDDGVPHLKQFAIGEYLAQAGYDWTASSLDDVTIILDYSLTSVTIKVLGWTKDEVYNVVL